MKRKPCTTTVTRLATVLGLVASATAILAHPYATCLTNNSGTVSFRLNEAADSVKVVGNAGTFTNDLGVISFTRDLAHKWAQYGIRVNSIAPGWFPSDMTKVLLEQHGDEFLKSIPLRRFGGPDDLKGAVVFLASRASDHVTGQTIAVDGGQSAW